MDGTSDWRWQGGWPLSSVQARDPDEAVAMALELVEAEKDRIKKGEDNA